MPAWDPNLATPIGNNNAIPINPMPVIMLQHELLKKALLALSFKVNVNGGRIPGTAMVVTVAKKDNMSLGLLGFKSGDQLQITGTTDPWSSQQCTVVKYEIGQADSITDKDVVVESCEDAMQWESAEDKL
ncbi:hypothetical protein BJ165DRAFT_1524219 [Panaeolus papilionaceus]|nr:hypothetical protein BJ165DRAFT_1524219 [Panaeolus papilionaceus]